MAQVDIVMPLYNKAQTVQRAIESIQRQRFTHWRLIVIDDGSTDEGPNIVRQLADERIVMIRQDNRGPGAARNAGIERADSPFIAFLDADDEWYPWYLENALKAIETDAVALVGTMYYEWPKQIDMTQYWVKRQVRYGVYSIEAIEDSAEVESRILFFHVGNSLMSLEVARKYGGFYEERCLSGEDTIFFMRITLNENFKIIGPAAVRHHREAGSLSNTYTLPLSAIFTHPEVVLRYCPPSKVGFAQCVIERLALRTARGKARHGIKSDAIYLVDQFPGMRRFGFAYTQCRLEIALSGWFRYWSHLRVTLGPPVRLSIKKLFQKVGLIEKIPDPTDALQSKPSDAS